MSGEPLAYAYYLDQTSASHVKTALLFWITFVKWVIEFSTQVIANYFGTYKAAQGVQIKWPGGRTTPPKDSPDCGFHGELCINLGIKQPGLIGKKCDCGNNSAKLCYITSCILHIFLHILWHLWYVKSVTEACFSMMGWCLDFHGL